MAVELRKKVLIVDDDELGRAFRKRDVVLAGYDAITAEDGREALQMIETVTPDLIVVDLVMPLMNGFETCRKIKDIERMKNVPIFILTGLQGKMDAIEAKMAGADLFLSKPIQSVDFIAHLKKYLGSPFTV